MSYAQLLPAAEQAAVQAFRLGLCGPNGYVGDQRNNFGDGQLQSILEIDQVGDASQRVSVEGRSHPYATLDQRGRRKEVEHELHLLRGPTQGAPQPHEPMQPVEHVPPDVGNRSVAIAMTNEDSLNEPDQIARYRCEASRDVEIRPDEVERQNTRQRP